MLFKYPVSWIIISMFREEVWSFFLEYLKKGNNFQIFRNIWGTIKGNTFPHSDRLRRVLFGLSNAITPECAPDKVLKRRSLENGGFAVWKF